MPDRFVPVDESVHVHIDAAHGWMRSMSATATDGWESALRRWGCDNAQQMAVMAMMFAIERAQSYALCVSPGARGLAAVAVACLLARCIAVRVVARRVLRRFASKAKHM